MLQDNFEKENPSHHNKEALEGEAELKGDEDVLFLARAGSWNALPVGYELIPGIGGRKPQRGAASCEALGSLGVHS